MPFPKGYLAKIHPTTRTFIFSQIPISFLIKEELDFIFIKKTLLFSFIFHKQFNQPSGKVNTTGIIPVKLMK